MSPPEALKPRALRPGATVGLVAPSGPVDAMAIKSAAEFIRSRGFHVTFADHILCSKGYLAGTDEERAADLNAMLGDPKIDAIFLAKGGFGSARLLNLIDYDAVRRDPKPLVGFSDATALQLALLNRCRLISFYGPLATIDFTHSRASFCFKALLSALNAERGWQLIPRPWPKTMKALSEGRTEGRLIGGCLSVLASLLGTPFMPNMDGAILFLEDVDEPPYRIDRYLTQLELAGALSSIAGVLLGAFTRCRPRRSRPSCSAHDVLAEKFVGRGYPVIAGLPFGHIARKITLPQGLRLKIDTESQDMLALDPSCRL